MSTDRLARGSPDRFAWEWDRYDGLKDAYRDQLRGWLGSTPLDSFKGQTVLDVGCGMGRNSYYLAEAGAKEVTAIDVEALCVEAANRTLAKFDNAYAHEGSVYDLDDGKLGTFDRVICIGVLHHLADPPEALRQLFSRVRPGGALHVWVYAKEGNALFIPAIQTLRFFGSRLPMPLAHKMARGLVRIVPPVLRRLPGKASYYDKLLQFDEEHLEHILLDQIIPRISHYWSRADVERLTAPLLGQTRIEHVNGNGWAVRIDKVGPVSPPTADGR